MTPCFSTTPSYMSRFFPSPRRRSSGGRLPYRANGSTIITTGWDPFEKPRSEASHPTFLQGLQNVWMNQSQRGRWLRTGGILTLLFLFYHFFFSNRSISSMYSSAPTTQCTSPYDPSRPLVQYVLCIDAGSTGSRIHVYKFNNCGPTPELEHEEFKMTEKRPQGSGLSSYKSDAEGAARSLDTLMDVAM